MSAGLVILIITSGHELEQHTPGGFGYVNEIFTEAGLGESAEKAKVNKFRQRLRVFQRALKREFEGRVVMRVINPWTPQGLWTVVRYRIRDFPCLLIAGHCYPLDAPLNDLMAAVREALQ